MSGNATFFEPGRNLPVGGRSEVVVCGGGPAGVAAAVAAARGGASVILLEAAAMPGGIMTGGLMPNIIDADGKGGFLAELLSALRECGAVGNYNSFWPETVKHFLESTLVAAGVEIHYNTLVCAVPCEGRKISAVIAESPSGREVFAGDLFVDCTGNGTVSALAGCGYDCGDPVSGQPQAASLCAIVGGVPAVRIPDFWQQEEDLGKRKLLSALQQAGCTPSYRMPTLFRLTESAYLLMSNHEHGVRPDDSAGISAALIQARQEIFDQISRLRKTVPEMANLCLLTTASALGLREGRRIHARYNLTAADLIAGQSHKDAVCRVRVPVDIHPSVADGGSGYSTGGIAARPFDVPLRSLIASDRDNLLLGGRCIGGDFYAHAAYRVLGNAIPIGEGAGIAAAAAVRKGKVPEALTVADFHEFGGNPHRFLSSDLSERTEK